MIKLIIFQVINYYRVFLKYLMKKLIIHFFKRNDRVVSHGLPKWKMPYIYHLIFQLLHYINVVKQFTIVFQLVLHSLRIHIFPLFNLKSMNYLFLLRDLLQHLLLSNKFIQFKTQFSRFCQSINYPV